MAIGQQSLAFMEGIRLHSAGLLAVGGFGSAVTARSGDAPASPPGPRPKSLAAVPLGIFSKLLGNQISDIVGAGDARYD